MKIHCFVFPECQSMIVMSRVLVICACKSNIFINRARERSIESGSSAYIYIIYIRIRTQIFIEKRIQSSLNAISTKQWITYYVEDYLSIPFSDAKSLGQNELIRITISAIILHMLSHNKSTNIDSYHVLTFQKWGDHARSRIHVKVRDALPLGSLYKFIDR